MAVSTVSPNVVGSASQVAPVTQSNTATADTFLKLLVTQMQNQDPLNPMDNAQVTSQMAQINTVNGIQQLNTTVQSLSSQFTQMQALQGAALVGRDVIVPGNGVDINEGIGQGGFELTSPADNVKVEILNAGGHVIDTMQLGAQTAGRHSFDWDATKAGTDTNLTFRVTATSGAATLSSTALMRDTVTAVSTSGDTLMLELMKSGSTPYSSITAFN
jgi:flagellar basal-body rod modification protein FlgD